MTVKIKCDNRVSSAVKILRGLLHIPVASTQTMAEYYKRFIRTAAMFIHIIHRISRHFLF